jgi:hypothetical protein
MQAAGVFANARADAQPMEQGASSAAEAIVAKAKAEASNLKSATEVTVQARRLEAETLVASAARQADDIIRSARESAEAIAGDAYKALNEAQSIQKVATDMRNVVEGYGDKYLKPTFSLIDDLAEEYPYCDRATFFGNCHLKCKERCLFTDELGQGAVLQTTGRQ